jgi:hypothetical protein
MHVTRAAVIARAMTAGSHRPRKRAIQYAAAHPCGTAFVPRTGREYWIARFHVPGLNICADDDVAEHDGELHSRGGTIAIAKRSGGSSAPK